MFSFLNPAVLWTLPLAAAPIVIHLFFLRRARKVFFTDLALLRAAYLRSLPSSRLRQWLLLAARCLLLAALIVAFAHPLLESSAPASAAARDAGTRVAVLVDRSYSMRYRLNGKPRFAAAVAAGSTILRSLGAQDRAMLIPFSDKPELLANAAWLEGEPAAQSLARLEPGYGGTDYPAALQAAYEALAKSSGGRRAIVVLSDGAAHGLRDATRWQDRVTAYDASIPVFGLAWPDSPDNAAIASVDPEPPKADGSQSLDARLSLFGPARSDWELSLWSASRREEEKRLNLASGSASATASFALRGNGLATWGRLQLREDGLPEDDAYYYSVWSQARPKVLLAFGGSRSMQVGRGAYFLSKLFIDPRGSLLPYQVEIVDAVKLGSLRLEDFQGVVLVDFKSISATLAGSLSRYVRAGGGLWLIPGRWDDPKAFQSLSSIAPGRWLELLDWQGGGVRPEGAKEGGFSWKDFDPAAISVRRGYLIEPEPGAQVWLRDAAARPLLVSRAAGAGRVFYSAGAFDIEWTNFAVKPIFAPWIDWVLGRLTGYSNRREWRTVALGRRFVRVWRPEEPAPSSVRVLGPSRSIISAQVAARRLEFEPKEPGLYFIESAAGTDVFAANLDRSGGESDLRPLSSPPWRSLRADSARQDFQRLLYGREARNDCLAAALLLMLAELALAARPAPRVVAALLLLAFCSAPSRAQEGDKFAWTQWKYDGDWDPYPSAHAEVLSSLVKATSVLVARDRRSIRLDDPALFSSPFLMITGRQAPPNLSDQELRRLRDYLVSGGFLWIEDASGLRSSSFDAWTRRTLKSVFPDSDLVPLSSDHVIYKTFFLLRGVGGRTMVENSLEGVDWSGRTAVLYSRNDILGALVKDPLGRPLYECTPGGEAQRVRAQKLALNIVMYALTGNYKADAVHQPFLLQKMRLGLPP